MPLLRDDSGWQWWLLLPKLELAWFWLHTGWRASGIGLVSSWCRLPLRIGFKKIEPKTWQDVFWRGSSLEIAVRRAPNWCVPSVPYHRSYFISIHNRPSIRYYVILVCVCVLHICLWLFGNPVGWIQYLHSLRWILNAPSPPEIHPASGEETRFCILKILNLVCDVLDALSHTWKWNREGESLLNIYTYIHYNTLHLHDIYITFTLYTFTLHLHYSYITVTLHILLSII